jgi:mono/diheme cytochrome c family protein
MKNESLFPLITLLLFGPLQPLTAVPADHADHADQMSESLVLFQDNIRILLKNNCVKCHGGEKIRADLNLNTREALLAGGENGPAITPGNAEDSLLLHLINHREEPFMPQGELPKLSPQEIDQVAAWINTGAAYDAPLLSEDEIAAADGPMVVTDDDRTFWSFKPLAHSPPPATINPPWAQTPIDHFIAATHETEKLSPNPPAPPATLARRLFLDITGLPPTPQQVEDFVQASTKHPASAVESLIDELLASPRYGEKWARHWLDVARFAESFGFEQDYDRPYAYHFRDFVIQAFNRDMPYDQFVKWQLAGDEFAPDNPLALMATGFLGAGVFPTQLTEKEFESSRYDELDDMLATTGTAMLGLTIGCARCHDHKYDPIPTRDYYRLLSTFTTTIRSEIDIDLNPGEYKTAHATWEKKHAPLAAALRKYESTNLEQPFQKWLRQDAKNELGRHPWQTLDPLTHKSKEGAEFTKLPDGSLLAKGKKPKLDDYTFTALTSASGIAALRLEALTHPTMRKQGPGRASNGNFALTNLEITAQPAKDKKAKPVLLTPVAATATHEQNQSNLSAKAAIDDSPAATGWAVDKGGIGQDQALVLTFDPPFQGFDKGTLLTIKLKFAHNSQHSIGRPRFAIASTPRSATSRRLISASISFWNWSTRDWYSSRWSL